ncbi:hypothetical protein C8J56DRAFT_181475 [Mycena floridula]|nr:hypothetical protein C8J56DRAFT_181475 [Mycena floridula]
MVEPVFPQEVFDIIIDSGCSDRAFLATCALVCSDWVSSSRYHLFRAITLAEDNDHKWLAMLNGATFLHKVHHVNIISKHKRRPQWTLNQYFEAFDHPGFDSIRSLSLTAGSVMGGTIPAFTNITVLELERVHFPEYETIFSFCSSFNSLVTLSLILVVSDGDCHPEPTDHAHMSLSSQFRSLCLDLSGIPAEFVLAWLTNLVPPLMLSQLTVSNLLSRNIPAVAQLIEKLEGHLSDLTIAPSGAPRRLARDLQAGERFKTDMRLLLNPSVCRGLRRLHLHIGMWAWWNSEWFIECLAKPSLEVLILELGDHLCYELFEQMTKGDLRKGGTWGMLDAILTGSKAPQLREVHFILVRRIPDSDSFFRARLPECHSRGILVFE